jgi:hypothetical protein
MPELGIEVVVVAETSGQEKVLSDIAERPLDFTLGLGAIGLACPGMKAIMTGEINERSIIDDASVWPWSMTTAFIRS